MDLVTGALRAVPATAVYPVLRGAALPYQAPIGAAAGCCWNDAVAAGLRAHCEALLVASSGDSGRDVRQFDTSDVADEQAIHLLRLLRAADQHVTVDDLSGILGLPAFAVHVGADPVVSTCAATRAEALRAGLERTVLRCQARAEGRPWLGTSAGRWPVEPPVPGSSRPEADTRCRVLTGALRRAG